MSSQLCEATQMCPASHSSPGPRGRAHTAIFTAQYQAGGFNAAAEHFGFTSFDSADDLGLAASVAAELHTGFHHRVKVLVTGCRVQCEACTESRA